MNSAPPPATDTVTITRAEWNGGRLRVEATSSNSNATLKVYVTSTGALLGTMSGGRFETNIASNPGSVTVKSSLGGEATRTVIGSRLRLRRSIAATGRARRLAQFGELKPWRTRCRSPPRNSGLTTHCWRLRQQRADTKRTHQKRYAVRLATQPTRPEHTHLQEKRVASDRSCTRVNGKECHEERPPAERCSARPRQTKGGPLQCCTPVWISVASVSTSTCLTTRGRRSRVGAAPPDADELGRLTARLALYDEPVRAAIESMNGARFVHDRLEFAGWQVEIADARV